MSPDTQFALAQAALVSVAVYIAYCFFKIAESMPSAGKAARNEARKLTANALSNVGVAFVVTGVVVPLLERNETAKHAERDIWWFLAVAALGFLLHLIGRRIASDIED